MIPILTRFHKACIAIVGLHIYINTSINKRSHYFYAWAGLTGSMERLQTKALDLHAKSRRSAGRITRAVWRNCLLRRQQLRRVLVALPDLYGGVASLLRLCIRRNTSRATGGFSGAFFIENNRSRGKDVPEQVHGESPEAGALERGYTDVCRYDLALSWQSTRSKSGEAALQTRPLDLHNQEDVGEWMGWG